MWCSQRSFGGDSRSPHRVAAMALAACLSVACADPGADAGAVARRVDSVRSTVDRGTVIRLVPRVIATYPHDPDASTQGLLWHDGWLYESTGLWGRSSLRRVDLATGRVDQRVELDQSLFGEGLARVGQSLVQLTWQNGIALRYDLGSFAVAARHTYLGEGWGLCYDRVDLWRSDGSSVLRRHDPTTFEEIGSVEVTLRGAPLTRLNELECAEGWIYANVLQSEEIVRIDARTGRVMAVVDASPLPAATDRREAGVLNGIAYREETQSFFLTGKTWPMLFEVVFVEARGAGGVS